MVKMFEICKHDFIELESKTNPKKQLTSLKNQQQDEYCKNCGLNRKPVFVNDEFSEWFYFYGTVPIGDYSYLGNGPIKFYI